MTTQPAPLALVTGGTSGIGAGAALALAKAGYDVIATGLTEREVETAPAHPSIRHRQLDVTSDASVAAIIAACPRLDALVNCAGMIRRANTEHDPEVFAKVIDVNLNGTQRLCALARPLLAKSRGAIVNTASMRSFSGASVTPAYSASKGAVMQLTKSLAIAYAEDGIRVNAIAPGWVATALTKPLRDNPEANKAVLDRTPMKRWADPADMAGPAMFLCSPAAAFVTGVILPVDGGYLVM